LKKKAKSLTESKEEREDTLELKEICEINDEVSWGLNGPGK
jgi:hypothetical protein